MSRLGVHIKGRVAWQRAAQARPPLVVMVTDDAAALSALAEALAGPTLLVAGAASPGDDWVAFWRGPAGQDVGRALDLWWASAAPLLEAAPSACWMGFQGLRDRRLLGPYLAFEAARVERLAGAGLRACVGNLATGLPDLHGPHLGGFRALCRAAQAHGGVLGVQEFGALYMWTGYGSNEWLGGSFRAERKFPPDYHSSADLCLRYRQLYQEALAPAGLGELPLAVTACGLGPTADAITAALSVDGRPTGGWRSCAPTWRHRDGEHNAADFYLRQLQWYDAQLALDPFVAGAAVYAWGSGDDYEIEGRLVERLLSYIASGVPVTAPRPAPLRQGAAAKRSTARRDPQAGRTPRYYITVDHPEVFGALWQQGEAAAEAARALLTWREAAGRFTLQTDDETLWQELYQYGQMLAQALGADVDGGELGGPKKDTGR